MTTLTLGELAEPKAYELLRSAPAAQAERCGMALNAIMIGCWEDAALHLVQASNETIGTEFSDKCMQLARNCQQIVKQFAERW